MTDVNGTKKNLINTIADALPLYAPPPVGFYGKVGLEVEMALYKTGLDKPVIPPAATMLKLRIPASPIGRGRRSMRPASKRSRPG